MRIFTFCVIAFAFFVLPVSKATAQFQYISPLPNSIYHNPQTNIILRNGAIMDPSSLKPELVNVTGTLSGFHSCNIILADDKKTILIYPDIQFTEGETIAVSVADGFKTQTNVSVNGTSFQFQIHPPRTASQKAAIAQALRACHAEDYGAEPSSAGGNEDIRDICDIIPFTITSTDDAFDGDVFYYNFRASDPLCHSKTILTTDGDSIFAEFDNDRGIGFTINKNGYLTYYSTEDSCFEMMDSTYTVVKKFFMGNGYNADEHEFLIFPNGYHFMMCYDTQPDIDLTAIGGLDSVDVTGAVLQQLDPSGNVVFQWRSWDYFQILDAIGWTQQLLPSATMFDYVHANSMELDHDGNLLLSSRHLCEITKINLATGAIMWRMGGDNNQFNFVNDPEMPIHFSGQHDFRLLPNGNYTMFNNGNYLSVIQSGAKEYSLDQTNKIATLVWSYKHPDINNIKVYGSAMGSVQRLPNGNTFIDWGLISQAAPFLPRFTEVDSAGNIVWEFNFVEAYYYISYRAFKFKWDRCASPADTSFAVTYVSSDSASLTWGNPNYGSSYIFEYKLDTATAWTSIPVDTNYIALSNLIPEAFYNWRVQTICDAFPDSSSYSEVQFFNTLGTTIIKENQTLSALTIYPNPTHGVATVSFNGIKNETILVSIIDLLGNVIQEHSVQTNPGKNEFSLDLRNVTNGVYLIQFKSAVNSLRRQIIVQ